MEKLSERIDTLKPRNTEKLKADLIDILIYLITLIPIANIITPLYNTEDYNWFKAVIMGSLIFVVANYFIRYFIPMKMNGKSIGKWIMNLQTVDYYGYDVKPGQLLLKESFYIFIPLLVFSKFQVLNYILLGVWFLFFLRSVYYVYFLTKRSQNEYIKEAVEYLEEPTEEDLENAGANLRDKLDKRKVQFKNELKTLKAQHKEKITKLKNEHKNDLSTLTDKEATYQAKLNQKLELDKLQEALHEERITFEQTYDNDILTITHQELDKAKAIIEANKEEEPDYYPISEFVLEIPKFINDYFEVELDQDLEPYEDEEGNKVTPTPWDKLIEKYNIDELPKSLISMKRDNLKDVKLHRAIESGNTFIVDFEFRYERVITKKDKKTKEKVEKIISYFKIRPFKMLMFKENDQPVINFKEPVLTGKAARRFRLHTRARIVQSRSMMDLQANTVTVNSDKFQSFFEEHRTEE